MSSWQTRQLKELVESIQTWNPLRAIQDEVIDYIDLTAVDQSTKTIVGSREIACSDAPSRARQLVSTGDVLVSTVRPNLNGVAKVNSEQDGATASTGFCVLRPRTDLLCSNYLFQWVKSPQFVADMVSKATGASYPAVSDRIIFESSVPNPPIAEQRRIAAILDQADALRAKRREALAQLDSLTQSIFIEMFGNPISNPKGWTVSNVGSLSKLQGGLQVTTARKNLPLEVPYLRVANVYRGQLDLREIKTIRITEAERSRTVLKKDDLLIVEGHGNPNEVGRSALWTHEITPCTHQNHLIRVRFDASKILPIYACEYLNSPTGRRHLTGAGKTTSGLNTINASNVRGTPIFIPPMELQEEFVEKFETIKTLRRSHKMSMNESDRFFASLQHRAFSGTL